MYILRVVVFSLDEPNLTRPESFRDKENLVKYKGKRTSREYTFILFLILSRLSAWIALYQHLKFDFAILSLVMQLLE